MSKTKMLLISEITECTPGYIYTQIAGYSAISISFEGVELTADMVNLVIACVRSHRIEQLSFIECDSIWDSDDTINACLELVRLSDALECSSPKDKTLFKLLMSD